MADIYFDPDIKDMLSVGLECMGGINAATQNGVIPVRLDDYQTVRELAPRILARLRGRNEQGQVVPVMPPGNPLPEEEVEKFATWMANGMPERKPDKAPNTQDLVG